MTTQIIAICPVFYSCIIVFVLFCCCSGLDSSTSVRVILLLKQLAEQGRTIICSIHQPSLRIYNSFDHLYAIADGQCIYSGSIEMLIPFLNDLELICPKTYDPFDFCKRLKFIQFRQILKTNK